MNITGQIKSLLEKYYQAFNAKKWNEFESFLNIDFTYFTDKCLVQDKSEFITFLKNGNWQGKDFKIYDMKIIPSGDQNFAVAVYRIEFIGIFKGETMTVYAAETTVFKKEKDKWEIVHCHSSNKI